MSLTECQKDNMAQRAAKALAKALGSKYHVFFTPGAKKPEVTTGELLERLQDQIDNLSEAVDQLCEDLKASTVAVKRYGNEATCGCGGKQLWEMQEKEATDNASE